MSRYFMGMYSDFHMRKVLIATILSSELSCVNINPKLYQVVTWINDNKYWKSRYVIMKTMFSRLRDLRLSDRNLAGTDKVYYYSIMIHIYIQNPCSDLEDKIFICIKLIYQYM